MRPGTAPDGPAKVRSVTRGCGEFGINRLELVVIERLDRRSLQHRTVDVEARAVARAVPTPLGLVEPQETAEVRAAQRDGVQAALIVAVYAGLAETSTHDARFPAWDIGARAGLGRHETIEHEGRPDLCVHAGQRGSRAK